MTNPIQTSWGGGPSSGALSTDKGTQTTEDWIESHLNGALGAAPNGTTSFVTKWTCDGGEEQVSSTKNGGETDVAFRRRHRRAVEDAMDDCPPEA